MPRVVWPMVRVGLLAFSPMDWPSGADFLSGVVAAEDFIVVAAAAADSGCCACEEQAAPLPLVRGVRDGDVHLVMRCGTTAAAVAATLGEAAASASNRGLLVLPERGLTAAAAAVVSNR